MSLNTHTDRPKKRISSVLGQLTFLNVLFISVFIILCSVLLYNLSCWIAAETIVADNSAKQEVFNRRLFVYLIVLIPFLLSIGIFLHYFFTKRTIAPIRQLVKATKFIQTGSFPNPLPVRNNDEIGALTASFNQLTKHLKEIEERRTKLLTDLAHELRTPLSNLNGYLEGLSHGVIEGTPELYESLHLETKRLIDMINQLDELSEWEDRQIGTSEVAIKPVILNSFQLFAWILADQSIEYELDIEEATLPLNQLAIQQVLMNLIQNAIQYRVNGAPLTLRGEKRRSTYYVSITGEGQPLTDAQKRRLFERFYRVESSRNRELGGSGLGLSLVREIIHSHDGTVGVTSEGDVHTFWFELPL